MKIKFTFAIGINLAILSASFLPAWASSERYPTNTEVQQMREKFRQRIPSIDNTIRRRVGFGAKKRTAAQIQTLASYVNAWAQVDPGAAPFLGEWGGQENWFFIFPSNVKGKVCVINMPGDQPEIVSFGVGRVANGQIKVNMDGDSPSVIIKEKNYLGLIEINKNKPVIWEQVLPTPLPTLTNSLYDRNLSAIIPQFNKAGCTSSLPN